MFYSKTACSPIPSSKGTKGLKAAGVSLGWGEQGHERESAMLSRGAKINGRGGKTGRNGAILLISFPKHIQPLAEAGRGRLGAARREMPGWHPRGSRALQESITGRPQPQFLLKRFFLTCSVPGKKRKNIQGRSR